MPSLLKSTSDEDRSSGSDAGAEGGSDAGEPVAPVPDAIELARGAVGSGVNNATKIEVVVDECGNTCAYYKKTKKFAAHCKRPGHEPFAACKKERTNTEVAQYAGRPLGYLFGWIRDAMPETGGVAHRQHYAWVTKANRIVARNKLHDMGPLAKELLRQEL